MNKLILFSLLMSILLIPNAKAAVTNTELNDNIVNVKIVTYSPYNADLCNVERHLYGKTYTSDTVTSRIDRIEKSIFNSNYPQMEISQRMNNILANYQTCYNTSPGVNIKNRLINALIGQPTGFTPPFYNSAYPTPYLNSYGPSYMRGYYGNNGWNYHNVPTMQTRSGIHILQ